MGYAGSVSSSSSILYSTLVLLSDSTKVLWTVYAANAAARVHRK